MLEDRNAQHDKETVDKYHNPTEDYEMSVLDYVMRPYADEDTGPIIITLPPVAEAKGRFYSFVTRGADEVNTITIQDRNSDSECWYDVVFSNGCYCALFYSDGLCWHMLGAFKYLIEFLWKLIWYLPFNQGP